MYCENCGKKLIRGYQFCMECGKPKPQKLHYHCDKCGWEPEDPANPPKFCPECGDPFTDDDRI